MNIFFLNECPEVSAQMMCDKHVPKMIVESGQMLSTVHRMLDGKLTKKPSVSGKTMIRYWDLYEGQDDLEAELLFYKAVHTGHPCVVWTMQSADNYRWHWNHMKALCDEYTYRFSTEKEPYKTTKTQRELLWPLQGIPRNIPDIGLTQFPTAMKKFPDCIVENDPIKSYQNYYHAAKPFAKWEKGRPAPTWWKGYQGASLHA